jgi:hypothetical protein
MSENQPSIVWSSLKSFEGTLIQVLIEKTIKYKYYVSHIYQHLASHSKNRFSSIYSCLESIKKDKLTVQRFREFLNNPSLGREINGLGTIIFKDQSIYDSIRILGIDICLFNSSQNNVTKYMWPDQRKHLQIGILVHDLRFGIYENTENEFSQSNVSFEDILYNIVDISLIQIALAPDSIVNRLLDDFEKVPKNKKATKTLEMIKKYKDGYFDMPIKIIEFQNPSVLVDKPTQKICFNCRKRYDQILVTVCDCDYCDRCTREAIALRTCKKCKQPFHFQGIIDCLLYN